MSPRGNAAGANPAAYTTTFAYNAFGDLTSQTDPLGHVASFDYDPNRNITTTTDANNQTTGSTYCPDHHPSLGRGSTTSARGEDTVGA